VNQKPVNKKPKNQKLGTKKPKNQKPTTSPASGGRTLRNTKLKTQPTTNTNCASWGAYEKKSGQTWEFSANTTFGQFWSDIGAVKDEIWWYQGIGMN
jgi:hypothetical protein